MITYTPVNQFTDIPHIYDLSDFVIGGSLGTSNDPIKALFNQTFYNNNRLARFEGVRLLTGNYPFDAAADLRYAFHFAISANATFTLPDASLLPGGYLLAVTTAITGVKALTIQPNGSQVIYDGTIAAARMYMHDGERLWLMVSGSSWEVVLANGHFDTAGESFGGRKVMRNTMVMEGGLVNRADVPRLAAFALSLTAGQGIVTDSQWLSGLSGEPNAYRGCFSTGNTTTTIRLPDERGMFDRFLDLGRGLDNARLHNYPGGYEPDKLKEHSHLWKWAKGQKNDSGDGRDGDTYVVNPLRSVAEKNVVTVPQDVLTNTGGVETNPKSIGKIPLIRY